MKLSEYELKNISFKANVDFCIAKDEWRIKNERLQ